jgi:exopolyphosphatase/guanosine-5'-triphosphate,3'-diphosphate pyrophosphatase
MNPERRAVVDVGTNSVKLLVAEVVGQQVLPLLEESRQTRLGQGFYETQVLDPARIAETAQAVAAFVANARQHAATTIRVLATSAARDARNAPQLAAAIHTACGLDLQIISGLQEADLAFQGVNTDPVLRGQPLLLLETGGGSTQFILGHDQHRDFVASFPIGSVRLMAQLPHSDPPTSTELDACRSWLRTFLESQVAPKLLPALEHLRHDSPPGHSLQLIGTGGTATILGCMEARLDQFDRPCLEATPLSLDRVRWHVAHLWTLPLAERKQIVGLPKNRADIILTGALIFEACLLHFQFPALRLSTRGLRFGAIL